jgi:ADP-ribosyl-[dinitrogen reductase] hydrolase
MGGLSRGVAIRHLMLQQGDFRGSFLAAMSVVDAEGGEEVLGWLEAAERGDGPPYYPLAGFVKIAFIHAFRHLLLASSYEQAIQETLSGGGDTDTNACIVGGLIGALHGIGGVPQVMWQAVADCQTELGPPSTALADLVGPFGSHLLAGLNCCGERHRDPSLLKAVRCRPADALSGPGTGY